MTVPGLGNVPPPGADWMAREIRRLSKEIAELRTARSGDYTTIEGTLDVPGNLNVTGDATITGTTVLGGALTIDAELDSDNYAAGASGFKIDGTTGNAEFNQLTLRDGIVGLAALSAPVVPAVVNATDFSNTFTGSFVNYLTATVTVPAGFTRAMVVTNALVTATTSTFVAVNSKVNVNGTDSDQVETSATNAVAVCPVPFAIIATGLSGSFAIEVFTQIAGTMTASSGQVYLNASVLFLR